MEMFFIFFGGMCTLILILEFVPVLIKKISTSSKIQKTKFLSDSEISNFDCTLNNKLINDIVVNLYSIYRNAYTSLNLDVLKKVCNYEIVNSIENEFKILDIIIPFMCSFFCTSICEFFSDIIPSLTVDNRNKARIPHK